MQQTTLRNLAFGSVFAALGAGYLAVRSTEPATPTQTSVTEQTASPAANTPPAPPAEAVATATSEPSPPPAEPTVAAGAATTAKPPARTNASSGPASEKPPVESTAAGEIPPPPAEAKPTTDAPAAAIEAAPAPADRLAAAQAPSAADASPPPSEKPTVEPTTAGELPPPAAEAPPAADAPAPAPEAAPAPAERSGTAEAPPASPTAEPPAAPAADAASVNPNAPAAAPAPGAASPIAAVDAATVAASENNWPCVQIKMQNIDAAAVWDGPPIDNLNDWFKDGDITQLVTTAVGRRTSLADVEKAVEAYAKSVPEAERDAKLTQLFAGVLSTANTQRAGIINGVERYQKRQRENAKEVERQGAEVAKLEESAPEDLTKPYPELDQAREKYDWFTRVFQERQANIPIACELPTLIEQRVFAVARAIRAQMKS